MSYDPLLAVFGLIALASATVPTTFAPTAYRGGIAIEAAALPSNPTIGTIAIDSAGALNVLKWWDGAVWKSALDGGLLGTIAANQIAIGSGVNTIGGSSSFTATTTAGALLVALGSGTSIATTGTNAFGVTITYSGANTTSPMTGITGVVTSTAAPGASGQFTYGIQGVVIVNPGGAVPSTSQYTGVYGSVTASSRADTNLASAVLYGMQASATFTTANTSSSTIVTSVTGLRVTPSVGSTNASGTNVIPDVYGINVVPGTWTASGGGGLTITRYYGLYLSTVTLSTATITSKYGIYQADATATNAFSGYIYNNHGVDATTTTTAVNSTLVTFSGNTTTGPMYGIQAFVTSTGAISTAGIHTQALTGQITINPSAPVAAVYYSGLTSTVTATSQATTNMASANMYGADINGTFNTANTSGAVVLTALWGVRVLPIITATNASGTNTVATVYGVAVTPGTWNCNGGGGMTVTNYFGLYLGAITLSTTTITNRYGVYQADSAALNFFAGQVQIGTAGYGLSIKEGANAKQGLAVLTAGTVTVNTTAITANSRIHLTSNVDGGTPGFVRVSAKINGTSFTITSSNAADTSSIAWLIVEAL